MEIKAVIGANYGDEGKGLVTNYLAQQAIVNRKNPIVVLNNGGPQRGHTVVIGNNKHVFHHFGSGTMQNAQTYITDNYIVNPILFRREYEELRRLGYAPRVYIEPDCLVTTPYDMLCSQVVSKISGYHDTCGLGIWETVKQYEDNIARGNKNQICKFSHYMFNLNKPREDEYSINGILNKKFNELGLLVKIILKSKSNNPEYYESAEGILKIVNTTIDYIDNIDLEGLKQHWIEDLKFMVDVSNANKDMIYDLNDKNTCIIIENGQGLLLDRDYDKRYGTPSKTGAIGAAEFINNYFAHNISLLNTNTIEPVNTDIEFVYVSRPYLTRHGNGPFIEELNANISNKLAMNDTTNIPNDFQGTMRFGYMDKDLLKRIQKDYNEAKDELGYFNKNNINYSLAITHTDEAKLVYENEPNVTSIDSKNTQYDDYNNLKIFKYLSKEGK